MYKPKTPFIVPLELLIPTSTMKTGVLKKTFPSNGELFYGSFRTFGGTERQVDGLYSVENTATIETWFNPKITSDCRIKVCQTGQIYDVLGEPENIEMRNQYLKFRVIATKGGA